MSIISIIGKPNVGKSTLFNKLMGRRDAVVHSTPNLTRDRHYGEYEWRDRIFTLIDTGGIEEEKDAPFIKLVEEQVDIAINESDLILFLVDNKSGITEDDLYIAKKIRKYKKRVILAVNKCDNLDDIIDSDVYKLGFDNIIQISAEHKIHTDLLKDEIHNMLPQKKHKDSSGIKFAIVGRPNVGKSSFINAITNDNRMIVSDIPGTTRDSVDTVLKYKKQAIILIDTAGIRRIAKIKEPTEYYTILRSKLAIKKSDIIIVIVDIVEGITSQDKKILNEAMKSLKPVVLVLNKSDALDVDGKNQYYKEIIESINYASFIPVIYTSAKNRKNVHKVIDKGLQLNNLYPIKFKKALLNEVLFEIVSKYKHPIVKRRRPRFYRLRQVSEKPLRFVIEVTRPNNIDNNYKRYIINSIREHLKINEINFEINYVEKTR